MTHVKICGITNLEDAIVAVKCGADSLGFNFYQKSPRYIEPGSVADIMRKVRILKSGVSAVGVFVNEHREKAYEIAVGSEIDVFQLHGEEPPQYAEDLINWLGLPVIKAVRLDPGFDPTTLDEYHVDGFLLDGFSNNARGGTGILADWSKARSVVDRGLKIYLAGGLSADNVCEAIKEVHPFAVDACSLLEKEKGRKDHDKVKLFIEKAKGTND